MPQLAHRIAFVQDRLEHEDRPVGVARRDVAEDVQHRLLGVVHRLHDDDHQVGLCFQLRDFRGDASRLAQSAGIEEAEKTLVLAWKRIHAGQARAGPEAAADLGTAAAGHRMHQRSLSRLGLAQEPDDRRRQR